MNTLSIDLLSYRFVGAPTISPDGRHAAYLLWRCNADKSGYIARANVLTLPGGAWETVTLPEGCTSMAWLADGRLACTVPGEKTTAVYAAALNGVCTLWGTVDFSAKIVASTADGRLLLTSPRPLTEEKTAEDGRFTVLDEFPFWYDGRGFISKVRKQLFLLAQGGEPQLISPANMDVDHAAYDAASNKIVFSGMMVEVMRPDWDAMGCYDVAANTLTMPIPDRQWRIRQVAMLDGAPVMIASGADESYYAAPRVIRVEADGFCTTVVAPGMHVANSTVSDVRYGGGTVLLGRGDCLYLVVTEGFCAQLYRMDKTGGMTRLTTAEGSVDGFDVQGNTILFSGLRDMQLPELYLVEGAGERQLTLLNGGRRAPMPEDIAVTNSEGVQVWGMVRVPEGKPGEKHPAVLVIHGGPNGAFGHVFHQEMQMLCDRGYYVMCCNPTGSDGRGAAFGDVSGRWGTVDYDDIMRFTDAVLAKYPDIDASRVGVFGGSYGGYMVNWIIGHTDRYCCAISDRSISNCPSKDVTGDNGIGFGKMHMKSDVYQNPEYMWDRSPLKYAYRVTTPTLFIHGEADTRCHLSQGMMMFTAIRENGVPARMAIFKGETHELCRGGRPRNRIRRLDEAGSWLDSYCKK